ncbi:hypothetical protein Droror1_Dr00007753, partial [Drosera rotundifolia]
MREGEEDESENGGKWERIVGKTMGEEAGAECGGYIGGEGVWTRVWLGLMLRLVIGRLGMCDEERGLEV